MFPAGDIDLVLMLGLASPLHCASMCGPLLCVASAPLLRHRGGHKLYPREMIAEIRDKGQHHGGEFSRARHSP